jgi:hypothetical protein
MTRDTKAFYIEYKTKDEIQQVYNQCKDKNSLALYKTSSPDQVVALSGSDSVDEFLNELGFAQRRDKDYYVYTILAKELILGSKTLFDHLPKRR